MLLAVSVAPDSITAMDGSGSVKRKMSKFCTLYEVDVQPDW